MSLRTINFTALSYLMAFEVNDMLRDVPWTSSKRNTKSNISDHKCTLNTCNLGDFFVILFWDICFYCNTYPRNCYGWISKWWCVLSFTFALYQAGLDTTCTLILQMHNKLLFSNYCWQKLFLGVPKQSSVFSKLKYITFLKSHLASWNSQIILYHMIDCMMVKSYQKQ